MESGGSDAAAIFPLGWIAKSICASSRTPLRYISNLKSFLAVNQILLLLLWHNLCRAGRLEAVYRQRGWDEICATNGVGLIHFAHQDDLSHPRACLSRSRALLILSFSLKDRNPEPGN